jgi:hypothetical protein
VGVSGQVGDEGACDGGDGRKVLSSAGGAPDGKGGSGNVGGALSVGRTVASPGVVVWSRVGCVGALLSVPKVGGGLASGALDDNEGLLVLRRRESSLSCIGGGDFLGTVGISKGMSMRGHAIGVVREVSNGPT